MPAVRAALSEVFRPEDDDTPVAARSRRDWIVDSALFLFAAVLAITTGVNSFQHGLHGPLLAIDAIGGVMLCLALWWRRRWPLGLGLASLPVLAVSSSAGTAGVIILYTVAAYRRWQAAVLIAAAQVALLPLEYAIHPQGQNSLTVYYLTGTLGLAVVAAWGMFRRSRRQAHRERAAGEPMLSPTITRRLIEHATANEAGQRRRHARDQLGRLTEREREVAIAIGHGKSNAEISRELYMSIATVKAHVSRLLEKLEFNNRVQIALLAHDAGEA